MPAQLLKGVDHADYIADNLPGSPLFSRSAAKDILQSPLQCYSRHPKLGNVPEDEEEDEKEDRKSGSIYHELLLGGGLKLAVCDYKDFRTDAAKADKALALKNGLVPIIRAKYEAALVHARAMRKRLEEEGIDLAEFETEVTGLWEHGETACKGRLDALKLGEGRIVDLKCVKSISRRSFENRIQLDALDIQAFTQTAAVEAAHPSIAGRIKHDFAIVQHVPPYDVMLVSLGPTKLSLGEMRWNRALKLWRRCLASGKWPGVGRVPDIEAKEWELTEELQTATTQAGDPAFMKGA